jgi:hypothetical protein
MGKPRQPNNLSNSNAIASGLVNDARFVARLNEGTQRISTLVMRLRASPLAALAVPVALTLLVAVAAGTVHPFPSCPGITPCSPFQA